MLEASATVDGLDTADHMCFCRSNGNESSFGCTRSHSVFKADTVSGMMQSWFLGQVWAYLQRLTPWVPYAVGHRGSPSLRQTQRGNCSPDSST